MQVTKTKQDFYTIMEQRRSVRVLGNKELLSQEQLEEVVGRVLRLTPTAFHAQEQRLVLLLGERHTWFWDLLKGKLKSLVSADEFPETENKLKGFASGIGTILLYQDTDTTKRLQEQFHIYKDNFPKWAEQASGMLKYTLWTSLVAEGYGVSLQHYTELIEQDVKETLNISDAWRMVGQIPFGTPEETPAQNEFMPLKEQLLIFS